MALETISQILSPTNATYINNVAAQRLISPAILENMFQGLVEKDGRGVDDKFVSETDANEAAQVFVHRIVPVKMKPREQGSSKNGASFSADSHYTQTVTVGIDILTTVDDPIIIPRARQDMIKVDLLAEQVKIYSDRLRTIINGATAASKIFAAYKAENDGKEYNKVYLDSTKVLEKFVEANSLLDEGDDENGIDIFPTDTRIAVFKMSYRPILKAGGILVLGGANYAYDIAKGNALSQGDTARTTEDGYWGEIDGVEVHGISNESLQHASEFLGLTPKDLKASNWVGYIASSYANARGVSTVEQTKVVDAVNGQGLILQPYTKFGVVSWYHKGNVMLHSANNYEGYIKGLKTMLTTGSTVSYKVKAAGSRLFPVITISAIATTGFTASATALDDFNTDHIFSTGAYVQGDAGITTVYDFIAAYNAAGAVKGTFTPGTAKGSLSLTSGKYLTVLCIADDGSVSLVNKVVA